MKQHPILFKTEMVQAILDGRKNQTRRVISERNSRSVGLYEGADFSDLDFNNAFVDGTRDYKYLKIALPVMDRPRIFPKYEIGDILWVRETYANLNVDFKNVAPHYVYKADLRPANDYGPVTWKPSIHMPKKVCRLYLEVVSVRPERLKDISEEDASNEGVIYAGEGLWANYAPNVYGDALCMTAKKSFETLWVSINGPESWNQNPYVWVYGFKQIENKL